MIKMIGEYQGKLTHYHTAVNWDTETREVTAKFPCWSKPKILGTAATTRGAVEVARKELKSNFKEATT